MATLTDNSRGALLMMASMAAFTLNDTFMKAASDQIPLFQALTVRGLVTTLLLFLVARAMGGLKLDLAPRDRWIVLLRTAAEVAAAWFFITALFNMPIANATAILQALPLAVTLAGALFLGEQVGWRRFSAILAGFFGVLLIVRPGAEGFTFYSVYALIAVLCVTVRDLVTRRLSAEVPSLTVAFAASAGVTLFGIAGSVAVPWAPFTPLALGQLALASGFIIGGYLFSVMAMRVGEVAVVSPFRYTALLWALVLGWIAFGEWPDPLTLTGGGIVVAMGVYTFYRERAAARQGPVPLRIR